MFSDLKKTVHISLTEFAVPVPRRGSIDMNSGFGRATQVGIEIHQKTQAARKIADKNFEAEVLIAHQFERDDFIFEIAGRMDGFTSGDRPKIEEIKSSFNVNDLLKRLKEDPFHPYCLQLKMYGYFYFLQHGKIPALTLHVVSSRSFESVDVEVELNLPEFTPWFELRLLELLDDAKRAEKREQRRRKAAAVIQFPFAQPRMGQVELIETIEESMQEKRPFMVQAPTGLGKTIGVLYPTLKESLGRGQKLLYVTPKNSQHSVAEEAIDRLQEKGAPIKAMTLTAKSKMCFKNEPICNPEFCEYAKDHYTKVSENKLIAELAKKKSLTERTFKKMGETYQVCPFELQMAATEEADAVICDYNYVFSPRSALAKGAGVTLSMQGKPNLVVDEAHNLPARAMDYFSPSLSAYILEKMKDEAIVLPKKYRSAFLEHLQESIQIIRLCAPAGCVAPSIIRPPTAAFMEHDGVLRQFLSHYLDGDHEIEAKDPVLKLSFYWSEFSNALEFVSDDRPEFFVTFNPNPATIKIVCCDASDMLKNCYNDFENVVAFSATLKPFEYYARLSGLAEKNLKLAEFKSPFSKDNRKIMIIPQISSKYSERSRSAPRICEAIQKMVSVKRGNYFVFFPSFDFLEKVASQFQAPEHFLMVKQERYMKNADVKRTIENLKDPSMAHIIFAVQGGVFSEGVDYPGDMIIGAFIVGPPLPSYDLERETMKNYYQEHYSAGADYAYTYPAMAKAIQAAGRVIRSETDKGLIVLFDDRFIYSNFAKSMPQDWFEESPRELVSQSILDDVKNFWQNT